MVTATVITVSLNPAVDRVIEVDGLSLGAHQEGRELRRIAGGKAINVSRVLAALGIRSVATGFLGQASRAEFTNMLASPLIADEFFSLPGRTRENVTIADRRTHQETHIRDVGLPVDERSLERLTRKLQHTSSERSIVIFGGSLPPGISPQAFAALVNGCTSAGARVAVDTSGAALKAAAGGPLWLIKPNAAELSELGGVRLAAPDAQVAAARKLTDHIETVLLTRGAEGACLLTRQLALRGKVTIDPQRLANTVGCGDVLLAAYVAGICRGQSPREALAGALAHASASACHVATAEFDPSLVAELLAKVEISEI